MSSDSYPHLNKLSQLGLWNMLTISADSMTMSSSAGHDLYQVEGYVWVKFSQVTKIAHSPS